MSVKRRMCGLAAATMMLLTSVAVFFPQNASASQWTTTTDVDFSNGDFFTESGFETVLHGTGVGAYVQNKKGNANWINESPSMDTGPRTQFAFANDSAEGRFIMFGGLDGNSQWRNDTWEYDLAAGEWEMICADDTPACKPPKRMAPSMAYDNDSKVAVMYGGIDDQGRVLEDTWEYSVTANEWKDYSDPNRPKAMFAHKMAYDARDQRVILVGHGASSMEVWQYDTVTHAWTNRSTVGGPSLRSDFALGYSYQAAHDCIVLFGGAEMMNVYDDTWEYDYLANSWSQYNPSDRPSGRFGASMTYAFRQASEGLVLWGGNSWTAETWQYSWVSGAPTWIQIPITTSPDPPRANNGLAYDPGHDALIVYGGESFAGQKLNDTWLLESGFDLEGKYASSYFDTSIIDTLWQRIFWNQTPANVPPNTQIRLQLNASSVCDDAELPVWRGPDGTSNTYYETPGEALWPGLSGNSCIKFLADMITYDPLVAPMLEDVMIDFLAGGTFYLASYSPTGFGIPFDAPIHLNFSQPADTANAFISVVPNVTFDGPWTWNPVGTKAKITHAGDLFTEATKYDVCVWASNSGTPLPGGKKCWFFTTEAIAPYIVSTSPPANQVDVLIVASVQMTFSEPMNTSSCWPYVTIDPLSPPALTFDGHSWSAGDTRLTLTHSVPFADFTTYTVNVPVGDPAQPCRDKSGMLLTAGQVANPWQFTTVMVNWAFFIVSVEPLNMQIDVPLAGTIKVTFNKDVDQASARMYVKEYDGYSWSNSTISFTVTWQTPNIAVIQHSIQFSSCRPYEARIWAKDVSGYTLLPNPAVPNPWRWQTVGPSPNGCAPYMVVTEPYNGEENVSPLLDVTIRWYYQISLPMSGMNPASLNFSVRDSLGNDLTSQFTPSWIGMGPDSLVLEHRSLPFTRCIRYTVKVLTAQDKMGRDFIPGMAENPFTFSGDMTGCPPYIVWSEPKDGDTDVRPTDSFHIKFSAPIDGFTVEVSLVPTASCRLTWSQGGTNLSIDHTTLLMWCTWYTLTITVYDAGGLPFPYVIRFETLCSPTYINETYPAQGQMITNPDDPIIVNFSEPMDNSSLVFSLMPPVDTLTYEWTNGDMTVFIWHSQPFDIMTQYTATVIDAMNKSGGHIAGGPVPNPWTFKVAGQMPYVYSTDPPDGAVDVPLDYPITIVFNKPINMATLFLQIIPPFTPSIVILNPSTVLLDHAPFPPCTTIVVRVISAEDLDGNPIVPGPVPNPFHFTTVCTQAPSGLCVHREPPDNILLTWSIMTNASYYLVFHSTDKFAPWPWTLITRVTTNSAILNGHLSDGLDHFYIVRATSFGGTNSTLGVLWHLNVSLGAGGNGELWLSLPYNTTYTNASAIAGELGCNQINVVGKWDSDKQKLLLYYCLHGRWRGQDFQIDTGDALVIGVVGTVDWAINGTDRSFAFFFVSKPADRTHYHFISLPYTGNISSASELVMSIAGGLGPGMNTKIDAVGKWNYSRQAYDVFRHTPTGWSGVDFELGTGDSVWIEIMSTFSWTPPLLTPEVP